MIQEYRNAMREKQKKSELIKAKEKENAKKRKIKFAIGSVSFKRLIYRNDKKPPKAYFLPINCTL